MKTTFVSVSRSGRETIWLRISPRGAEFTPHAAPGLRRDAERGPVAVGNIGRFDVGSLLCAEEVFLRAVGRFGDPFGRGQHLPEPLGQQGAPGSRDIGHQHRVFDVLHIEPAGELPCRETRQARLGAEGGEFRRVFPV